MVNKCEALRPSIISLQKYDKNGCTIEIHFPVRNLEYIRKIQNNSASPFIENFVRPESCLLISMFKSFFLAGFECATGYNRHWQWIDQIEATQHDKYLREDYERLRRAGIHAVREGIRWPLIDRRGSYDLRQVKEVIRHARAERMDVIFDLFHYGFPDDVNLFADSAAERFSDYCRAVARCIASNFDGPFYFTPVNEPSFFAWAGGEVGLFAPHATGRGPELKYALARAAIEGANAIWSVIPEAEMVTVDPVCHVVPASPEEQEAADQFNHHAVFESFDMISGRLTPELGGSERHLGTIGINYYWNNQWVLGGETLAEDDERRVPLRDILRRVCDRYNGNVFIGETAHAGDSRADWITNTAGEVIALLEDDIPIHGICLYPIIGMPEWHSREEWTCMGLWDLTATSDGTLERRLHIPSFDALVEAQSKVGKLLMTRRRVEAMVQ